MTPEEIRNQCEDDADRAPSDLTVWRDRGEIIAAQQTRIAQLEAQIARVRSLLIQWPLDRATYPHHADYAHAAVMLCERELQAALDGES